MLFSSCTDLSPPHSFIIDPPLADSSLLRGSFLLKVCSWSCPFSPTVPLYFILYIYIFLFPKIVQLKTAEHVSQEVGQPWNKSSIKHSNNPNMRSSQVAVWWCPLVFRTRALCVLHLKALLSCFVCGALWIQAKEFSFIVQGPQYLIL